MATDMVQRVHTPDGLSFSTNFAVALFLLLMGAVGILQYGGEDDAALHIVLDTSVALSSAAVALLLWDISRRTDGSLPLFLAISFGLVSISEILHALTTLGWFGGGLLQEPSQVYWWRAGTWGPPAYILAIGAGAALFLQERGKAAAWSFAIAMVVLAIALVGFFLLFPRYTEPGFLGITRPAVIFVPVLWIAIGLGYWRERDRSAIAPAVAMTSLIFAIANGVILYSEAPDDSVAMVAHLGKFIGTALLLFNLTQIGAADTARRREVERQLTQLNRDLDERVSERTTRLRESNERMHLLEQITRSISQRHDVQSVFQVVIRTLEDRLPADFACIGLYDRVKHSLTVSQVGIRSATLGRELGMSERAEVPIDENGLSRCVRGELVYEPNIADVDFPFPRRLARQGLRSLVVTPLIAETEVFGVLVVARHAEGAFLSTDCEFLRQLGEHVALAAHQAQLRDSLQRAYDDLRQTQQAVLQQERLRAIGQMASGIAHDINNAISPVAIYTASLLERERDLPARIRDYLELVGRVVKDVSATVARMRDFYRQSADDSEVEPLNLNELVPQVVELTRARWGDMPQQRGVVIKVSTDLEARLPTVLGNAGELREAITNLIFNAVDAMPDGGTITVRTRSIDTEPHRHLVRLEVGDTGAGMDEETRRRCLEPFFSTKGERGTGLGLAMVYGAAQRHRASLGIDSEPGRGTRMVFEFPVLESPPETTVAAAIPEVRPLRLLLVDDDPAVLNSTQMVLELDGHAVTAADGGQAGIDILRGASKAETSFDVVITDLGMPYVDGNTVARAVKELFPSTTVVLLTGWGKRMSNRDEQLAHVDFVLPKPLDLNELRSVLQSI